MAILVTGGAGFIGSHFIKYFLEKYNYTIINLDSLTYAGSLANLREVGNNNYQFVNGDIRNAELLQYLFREFNIQAVINFAAETHVDRSIVNSMPFLNSNVFGTYELLETAKEHWKHEDTYRSGVRFIQISTDEVYGSIEGDRKFSETTNLAPNNPYSATKASADLLVRSFYETYGFPAIITRCSNNYGPYQFTEKFIPHIIGLALTDNPLSIYGDGRQIRDWLHVSDHCRAIDEVFHKGKDGEVYNIGGNSEIENIEVAKMVLKYLNKNENLIEHISDRLGHDKRYSMDYSKIKDELGWQPEISFREGLEATIDWYVENQEWIYNMVGGKLK